MTHAPALLLVFGHYDDSAMSMLLFSPNCVRDSVDNLGKAGCKRSAARHGAASTFFAQPCAVRLQAALQKA